MTSTKLADKVVEGKRIAYVAVLLDKSEGGGWGIGIAVEDQDGYHPVQTYGPFAEHTRARDIVEALNKELGLTKEEAWLVAASSMRKAVRRGPRGRR
jgi:hypothetical protein